MHNVQDIHDSCDKVSTDTENVQKPSHSHSCSCGCVARKHPSTTDGPSPLTAWSPALGHTVIIISLLWESMTFQSPIKFQAQLGGTLNTVNEMSPHRNSHGLLTLVLGLRLSSLTPVWGVPRTVSRPHSHSDLDTCTHSLTQHR